MDEMNFWNLNFVVVAYNRSHFGITEKEVFVRPGVVHGQTESISVFHAATDLC